MTPLEIALLIILAVLVFGLLGFLAFRELRKNKEGMPLVNPPMVPTDDTKELQQSIAKLSQDLNVAMVKSFAELNEKIVKQNNEFGEKMHKLDSELQEKINVLSKGVNEQLTNSLKTSNDFFKDFSEKLGKIDEAQKNLGSLEDNVLDLTKILRGNQSRGRFGELTLSNLLNSVFGDYPDGYSEQYTFKNLSGETIRPDAVVFLPEPNHLICIDSKFPFSNYETLLDGTAKEGEKEAALKQFKKEVLVHIGKVAGYVVPNVTAPFAILFVPSDGIMWFINTNLSDVVENARSKNVILASPSTLHPLLATVNFFNKQVKRAENLGEIEKALAALGDEFRRFKERWTTLATRIDSLERAKNDLNTTSDKITKQFDAISSASIDKIDTVDAIEINPEE